MPDGVGGSEAKLPQRPWVALLVDDEPDVLRSVGDLIEGFLFNVKVVRCPSARQALEVLDRDPVDVIISDFKMPGMDGIEFLRLAHERHPPIPRVMLTAFANPELARRAVSEAFVQAFVSKSSPPETLLGRVGDLLPDGAQPTAAGAPPAGARA